MRRFGLVAGGGGLSGGGKPAPARIDDSFRFEGKGRIGLYGDFATAEANGTVVDYECKWSA